MASNRIVDVNERFCHILGWQRQEIVGRTIQQIGLRAGVSPEGIGELRRELALHGALRDSEAEVMTRDGEPVQILLSGVLVAVGGEACVIFQGMDIRDRKRAEAELQRHRDHLEELLEERTKALQQSRDRLDLAERLTGLGTLAAGIAHQLNNPLGSISMGAELLLLSEGESDAQTSDDPATRKRILEDIVEQAARGGDIVRSVLQFSRGEAMPKSVQDLRAIVERAVRLTAPYAQDRSSPMEFTSVGKSCPVLVSGIEIEQALVNLIRNAVESREAGAAVVIEPSLHDETARIDISDDGCGMDSEQLKLARDPFYTTRLKRGGTGLGLSVAYGIVADHQGRLDITSEPDKGTRVTLLLPLAG